jgi:hypothetical protein
MLAIAASALAEEALDRNQRRRVGLAVDGLAPFHAADQPRLAQLLDVVRHGRERQVELTRKHGDAALEISDRRPVALTDQLIDGKPVRIGEGPKHRRELNHDASSFRCSSNRIVVELSCF